MGLPQEEAEENRGTSEDRAKLEARIQRLFEQEQARHERRLERIEAIRFVATQEGDEEALSRIQHLIKKENEIHTRRLDQIRRVQSKMRANKPDQQGV